MNVILLPRVQIALRSLDERGRDQVTRALDRLRVPSLTDLPTSSRPKRVAIPTGEVLYAYRAGDLRLLLSKQDDTWTVEDLVTRDRMDLIQRSASSA